MNKTRIVAILMIILVTVFTLSTLLPRIEAVDVEMTSVSPATRYGRVGDTVNVVGTINYTDGLYRLFFGNIMVKEANAIKNNVSAAFTIPSLPQGNYTLTLQDVSKNINATSWFFLQTAYYIKAIVPQAPGQLQENSTARILVNVTGGAANTVYSANVTVKVPAPANTTYWSVATLSNTTTTGNGTAMFSYPSNFGGSAHTNYTGIYTVTFNGTLAADSFFVGLTNSTQYHRLQTVDVRAVYKPYENVTLKITGKNVNQPVNLTADSTGMIHYANWSVPSNAAIGSYRINITSISHLTVKNPPDVQNFTVPGFDVNVTMRNLAGDAVQNVNARLVENALSVANGTSDSAGLVQMKLEVGNYNGTAYYRGERVGARWINITDAVSLDFSCNLTNLRVLVSAMVNAVEVPIPDVNVYLSLENKTMATGLNGTAVARSLLPNHAYTLNSSRYGFLFNTTRISQMPAVAWFNKTVFVPNATLSVYVTDGQNRTISDTLTVKVTELSGGLFNEMNTIDGTVIISSVIGKYHVAIYGAVDSTSVKLNETTIDLFQNKGVPVVCKLYGLNVSVRVVDYFGQLVPNANVIMRRENLQYAPSSTSGGLITFTKIIGGDLQIEVYLPGHSQPDQRITPYVDSSNVIEVRLEQYLQLAGFVVGTSQFATAMLIVFTLIAVLLVEVYRRRRSKTQKSSS